MTGINCLRVGFFAAACILVCSGEVQAQDATKPGTALEEIVVTAQKREERLLDVPISMAAITEGAMRDAGATQLSSILAAVPGVGIVDSGSSQQTIEIRGISAAQGNSTVGYYLDELPFSFLGMTALPDVRTYDLKRIEILRGPQGTLYGDGSLGGTIRMLTNDPDLTRMQASVDLLGATTKDGASSHSEQGMFNLPLMQDSLGLRLVGSHEKIGGWVDNLATGVKDQNDRTADTFRGKIRYALGDRLDIVLSGWHTKETVAGDATSLPDRTTPDPLTYNTTRYDLYGATIRYSFDAVDLVSATSRMKLVNDQFLPDYFGFGLFDTIESETVLNQELRLTSRGSGPFRWSSGLSFRQVELHTDLTLPGLGFLQNQFHRSNGAALFGEATWSATQQLDLTLGLRLFQDKQLFREPVDPALLALIQTLDPTFTGTTRPSFHSVNPKLNIAYHPSSNWLVYGNVAKGFRTGQAQPVISLELAILANPPLIVPVGIEPEKLWSYEIGTKGTLADGSVELEADVFYNHWSNIQTLVFPAPRVGALVNGGPARTQGFETSLAWMPVAGLRLQLAGSYVNAKYLEDVANTNIHDGDRIPHVPKFTLSASANYRWALTEGLEGLVRADFAHASERTDTVNLAVPSDAVNSINLRLGLEGRAWGAYLSAENLTDEDKAIDAAQSGNLGQARLRPRTLGLQLRYKYN